MPVFFKTPQKYVMILSILKHKAIAVKRRFALCRSEKERAGQNEKQNENEVKRKSVIAYRNYALSF